MKKLLTLLPLMVFFLTTAAIAQQDTPSKEFTVSIAETNIYLSPGETKEIDVKINRSVKYRKTKIDLYIDNKLPSGVTATFKRGADWTQMDKLVLKAADTAASYNGTLILKASSARLTKGTMFNLSVNAGSMVSDGKE